MRVAIIYATREGQTRSISEYLAGTFRARDVSSDVFNVKQTAYPDLDAYDALVLAASVHLGKHETELVRFVKHHRDELERIPTAFLSVSMSQAGVEMPSRTPEQQAKSKHEIDYVLDRFFA